MGQACLARVLITRREQTYFVSQEDRTKSNAHVFRVKSNILISYGGTAGLSGRGPLRDHQIKKKGGVGPSDL